MRRNDFSGFLIKNFREQMMIWLRIIFVGLEGFTKVQLLSTWTLFQNVYKLILWIKIMLSLAQNSAKFSVNSIKYIRIIQPLMKQSQGHFLTCFDTQLIHQARFLSYNPGNDLYSLQSKSSAFVVDNTVLEKNKPKL